MTEIEEDLYIYDSSQGVPSLIDKLIIAGLFLGLSSMMIEGHLLAQLAYIKVENVYDNIENPTIFKLIKLFELACIISGGILAYIYEGRFISRPSMQIMVFFAIGWMSGHAVLSFKGGFIPSELIGTKGPGVWWTLFLLYAGMSKERWGRLYPYIKIIVVIASLEMIFRIVSVSGVFDRVVAQRHLRMSLHVMLWVSPLVFLVDHKTLSKNIFAGITLILIMIASLMTATRSWLVICCMYTSMISFLVWRRVQTVESKIVFSYLLFALMVLGFILVSIIFEDQFQGGIDILSNRLDSDTRSWQLEKFFRNIPISDFFVGTGPRGTWRMGNIDYAYVDGVYFFLLFLGGIPLLLSYLYLVIFPPIRCWFMRRKLELSELDFACIVLGLIWGIVMSGLGIYTAPNTTLNHYIVLLCVGRCWGLVNFPRNLQ